MDEVNGQVAGQQTSTVQVCFGDGSSGAAQRTERVMLTSDAGVSRSIYTVSHLYAGISTYTALCLVGNRTDELSNVPNSFNTLLGFSTTFSTNLPNTTPALPREVVFRAAVNQRTTLAFQATDAEGDSLLYVLSKPQTAVSSTACVAQLSFLDPYLFPNDVRQRGTFRINARNGTLTWDAPTEIGRFVFAIAVQERRNGILLSQTNYEQIVFVGDRPGGIAGTIPPYEPAQLSGQGIITGVAEPEASQAVTLSVFPVPTNDQLRITINLLKATPVLLQLTDVAGHTVYEEHQKTPVQHYEHSIDMRALSPGIYILQAIVEGQTVTRKVLKR